MQATSIMFLNQPYYGVALRLGLSYEIRNLFIDLFRSIKDFLSPILRVLFQSQLFVDHMLP